MSEFSTQAPKALQQFQRDYGLHLRSPNSNNAILKNIPARRSEVYESLFFNNICGFINNCFPVARQLFSEEEWLAFSRHFFSQWRSDTPYFSEIPREFVAFMQSDNALENIPPWLGELLQYEWLELEVDIMNASPIRLSSPDHKMLEQKHTARLFTTPTLKNCSFKWPVHRISTTFIPDVPEPTFLALYRDSHDRVQFLELNAMTAGLLEVFRANACTSHDALNTLAELTAYPNPEQLIAFGSGIIDDFIQRNILITYNASSEDFERV